MASVLCVQGSLWLWEVSVFSVRHLLLSRPPVWGCRLITSRSAAVVICPDPVKMSSTVLLHSKWNLSVNYLLSWGYFPWRGYWSCSIYPLVSINTRELCRIDEWTFDRFVGQLLRLLVCNHDRFGAEIQREVKELTGEEMSAALYPILFDQIKIIVEKFFDQGGQIIVSDYNTQFIEHVICIMKDVLNLKEGQQTFRLGITCIEAIMLNVVR